MIYRLLLIFLISNFCANGQENDPVMVETLNMINGIWLLKSIDIDSTQILQTEVKGKVKHQTYINSELLKTEEKEGWSAIELSFQMNGKGGYQGYQSYQLGTNQPQAMMTCQPLPEIKLKGGNVVIHFISMGGEWEDTIIELTNEKLVMRSTEGAVRSYKKYK
jgi:hypothetical protein